jgi:hypothetical protein
MSGDIPLSVSNLEKIVEVVATELLEQWAIDDRFTEENIEKAKLDAIDDTLFVVNSFMNYFNEAILTANAQQPNLII